MDWKASTFHPTDPVQSISLKLEFSGEPMRKRGFHGQFTPIKIMKETIQRDAFKFSVGRAIFCSLPECGVILDWKRAAEFSACKGDKYVSIKVFCAECADRVRPTIESKLTDLGLRLEIIDGRKLWSPSSAF
jgi:hypothetical protein